MDSMYGISKGRPLDQTIASQATARVGKDSDTSTYWKKATF
jgi:hypothetical protein